MRSTKGRLLETMPPRTLDFYPGVAHAVDTLDALCDPHGAKAFAKIAVRVDAWPLSSGRRHFSRSGARRLLLALLPASRIHETQAS